MGFLDDIADELGLDLPRTDPRDRQESSIVAALRSLRTKADASHLLGDERLVDTTIKVKIAPSSGPERVQQSEEGKDASSAAAVEPAAKRLRRVHFQEQEQEQQQQQRSGRQTRSSRARPAEADAATGEAEDDEAGVVATMRVHGAVLAQRSPFFDRALRGAGTAMLEGQTRTVVVAVEDEQEAAAFQQLIKLTYSPSYTKDEDGRALSKDELLRLLVLANRFCMDACVAECAGALTFDNHNEARAFFGMIPEELRAERYRETLQTAMERAGDAIARALGPVELLWRPGGDCDACDMVSTWLLREEVTTLPLEAIEAVLRSEQLRLKSENYAFTLALWWVLAQPGGEAERKSSFERLARSLRVPRMSAEFVLSALHAMQERGCRVEALPILLKLWGKGRRTHPDRREEDWLPRSRVEGDDREEYIAIFGVHFTRAAIEAAAEPRCYVQTPMGVLHGHPCYLELFREDADTWHLYLFSEFLLDACPPKPRAPWEEWLDGERGFEFVVLTGSLGSGALPLRERERHWTCAGYATKLLVIPNVVLDAIIQHDRLHVDLTLEVKQERGC